MHEPGLAERLGGRWSISLIGYLIGVTLTFFVVLNLMGREGGGLHLPAVACTLVAAALAAGTIDLVLHHTVFARRAISPVPWPLVCAKHLAGGLVLAASMGWTATLVFDDATAPPASRWLSLPLTGLWWGATITVTLDLWARSSRMRLALNEELDRLNLVRLHQDELTAEFLRRGETRVTQALERLRVEIDDASVSLGHHTDDEQRATARALARSLRQTSQGVLRETGSALWTRSERDLLRVPWRTQIANVLRTQPLRPVAILTLGVLPRIIWEIEDLGLVRGGSMMLVASVLVLVECRGANRAMELWPRWRTPIFVFTVALMQFGVVVASAIRNAWIPGYVATDEVVARIISGIMVVIMSSGWASFWSLPERRQALFTQRLSPAREQALARSAALAEAARTLAQDLHGGAQARLFACALALERAADNDDVGELNRALATTRAALLAPMSGPQLDHDLDEAIQAATQVWKGLCEVSRRREPGVEDGADPTMVRRIVDEALVNAVRHGGARHVEVALMPGPNGRLRLEIRDDGTPGSPGSRRGLGSAIVELATHGRWGRVREGQGTLLWAELAPAAAPGPERMPTPPRSVPASETMP